MKKTCCFPIFEDRNAPKKGEKTYPRATDADHNPNDCIVFSEGDDLKIYRKVDDAPKYVPYNTIGSHN